MNFVLGQVLGEGSAGIVYQGTWNNRVVAIKKFVGQHTRHAEQEMKLLRTLNHPNIIQCFDHQQDRTDTYLIMEFIEGGTLFEYIQRSYDEMNTNSYWYKCKSIANDIAQGMNYLHERNVIHGDLKSHNILLQLNEEQAKICDFGLSKTMSDTRSHMTTPTKRYTSAQGTCNLSDPKMKLSLAIRGKVTNREL
ncbi:unnamed protein product [Didymodactylos carnosus]|uniref:Protein kinase domain-containing protein n=1 Tax=Didymodactylos carnosus TaxID=1234261 RepID=A0A815ZEZ5_9BILA|nr:unnamed protein product [Didymodactylos carnosus]CAF1581646.1 unnamed protein product [Didymodactylos carnosus]CAF4298511.1 unnamed protein product [Didymodactylos carnosus]CAF4449532.1 unnamed protein product [Didymodactylos carnosus]